MVVLPGEVSMHKWVAQKLNPMIEETPASSALSSVASRDSSQPRTFKDFAGGQLYIEHAGSPSRLKSTSVRKLIVDELDEFAANLRSGDDPVEMLDGRTSAFPANQQAAEDQHADDARHQPHRAPVGQVRPAPLPRAVPGLRPRAAVRMERPALERRTAASAGTCCRECGA
jgi:hypothetical protein